MRLKYRANIIGCFRSTEVAVDLLKAQKVVLGAPIPVRTGVQLDLPHGAE